MRQFRIVDVRADSASVVGDQFRESVEAVERNNKKTKSVNEVIVGVGVVRGRRGGKDKDKDAPLRDDLFVFGLGDGHG